MMLCQDQNDPKTHQIAHFHTFYKKLWGKCSHDDQKNKNLPKSKKVSFSFDLWFISWPTMHNYDFLAYILHKTLSGISLGSHTYSLFTQTMKITVLSTTFYTDPWAESQYDVTQSQNLPKSNQIFLS